jgi:hypothetical protein
LNQGSGFTQNPALAGIGLKSLDINPHRLTGLTEGALSSEYGTTNPLIAFFKQLIQLLMR